MHPKPKKRLGQVFLVNTSIQDKIIEAVNLTKTGRVLEIGPGKGQMSRKIANSAKELVVVEIDKELCDLLKDDFKGIRNIKIVNENILKLDIAQYFKKGKFKVIGNIPYYITTPIIEHLFKYLNRIDEIYLMVQKEFAKRLVVLPKDKGRSALSCFAQFYTEPEILFLVKRGSFRPMPKVDSAFVKLGVRKEPAVKVKDRDLFFKVIRASFQQRRKTLRNSLKGIVPSERLSTFFLASKINPNIRPEDLSLQAFADLANSI